jgi:hypothetical protein
MFQLDNLRRVTRAKGFLHTFSTIIVSEAVFYSADQIKKRNRFDLISYNEIALLLSLLSESPIDIEFPDSREVATQYQACKSELETLHREISSYSSGAKIEDAFTEGSHFVEPIYYSAGSGFWFDYLELAPKLYELDKPFLIANGYDIGEFSALLREMQATFKNRLRDFIREQQRNFRKVGLPQSR